MRGFIISLLLTSMMFGGYFSDNFLKFSTLYGSASVSSPIKPKQTIEFTGSEIAEETEDIEYRGDAMWGDICVNRSIEF